MGWVLSQCLTERNVPQWQRVESREGGDLDMASSSGALCPSLRARKPHLRARCLAQRPPAARGMPPAAVAGCRAGP